MSTGRDDLGALYGERFSYGTTTSAIGVSTMPGQAALLIKMLAGGTLEIVAGSSGAAGSGYPLSIGEVISADCGGKFYVQVSGATCTFALLHGRSSGFEVV